MSDTHGIVDDALFNYFAECDEVWHAGDLGSMELLASLRAFRTTGAVYGNVDGAEIRKEVPRDADWDCEGVRVYMTHIGGYPGNYDRRVKPLLAALRPGLFICGHSHILRVMRDPTLGLIHMNPGAAGHHGWHQKRTALRFTVNGGGITAVEAIELGPRGRKKPPRKTT